MTTLELDRVFQGRRVPGWLREVEAEPEAALQDLLLGRAALGHLNADEPSEVLLDWLDHLGSPFAAQVDAGLAFWIGRSWGKTTLALPGASPAVVARAWMRAADLVAFGPGLERSAQSLRVLFLKEPSFLRALAEGRARDPEGRAWFALARHQADRSLLPEWWSLCSLPPDVPWYHGTYGIQGLRGLPAERPEREGLFAQEVADGLARLADALAWRSGDGWLSPETAQGEFVRVAELTMAAYSGPDRWVSFWRNALRSGLISRDLACSWVEGLFPDRLAAVGHRAPGERRRWVESDPEWPKQAGAIAAALKQGDWSVLVQARELLAEQRRYAEVTGNGYFAVRSASYFAGAVRRSRPDLALEWADLARQIDPWDAVAWNTRTTALLELGNLNEARVTALQAVQRFPDNVVARNGLGEVLKAQGRWAEAEAVFRETVRETGDVFARVGLGEVLKAQGRLPEAEAIYRETVRETGDVFARTGLGEVLKAQGRLSEAEAIFRETVRTFPDNVVARNGLGEALKAQGYLPEAEAVFRETVKTFPDDIVARNSLEGVLKAKGRLGEAEVLQREAQETFRPSAIDRTTLAPLSERKGTSSVSGGMEVREPPSPSITRADVEILLQDVYLLRRWGGAAGAPGALRTEARRALAALIETGPQAPELVGTLGLLEIEEGDLEQALSLLREATRRFPGSARVRYALARAEREVATRRGRLDLAAPEAPVLSWRRLSRLDERLRPLQLLGEARTWLAQTDGAIVAENARSCLTQLGRWIGGVKPIADVRPEERKLPATTVFLSWWADQVGSRVFGAARPVHPDELEDLGPVEERLKAEPMPLNYLEEDWLQHFARA